MSKLETATELMNLDVDIDEVAGLKTQFDVFRFVKRLAESYGYRNFMVLNLPPSTARGLAGSAIINNWPAELVSLFDREGLLQSSHVVRRLRRSTTPFFYDLEEIPAEAEGPDMREIFGRFGIVRGGCFPVSDAAGARGAVVIGGTGPSLNRQQMMELTYASIHIFDKLAEIRNLDIRPAELLTEREVDCLNWTAAGKTSAEIAEILGLSEHTVNHYLNRAAKKLDTVNRTQAVAKALRIGLIK
ncbi:LuxR family transcriptional regulator [Neorhizobium sp. NCHU2750]|uniref:LuxR family transcriptional regulator n=1 Tax=Neorhizobium sp. NCHU2750 TaxID=1825976 RepID=UPI000E766CD8|nr:LuxR family transcriptional regulator [Neorhizobium sp. NCHU2750]